MFGWVKKILAERRRFRRALERTDVVVPVGGRSSVEEPGGMPAAMAGTMAWFGAINPSLPFDLLDFLVQIAPVNPDINHAITNIVTLANSGHSLMVDAANDATVERALDRLNMKAKSLYPRAAGIDGLVNQYLRQICVTGAISSEDVIAPNLRDGVQRVALVPVQKIRFHWDAEIGDYAAFQHVVQGDPVRLEPSTYKYFALWTQEDSPYALPPFASAIEPILNQRDMQKNFQYILKKYGMLGLVSFILKAPMKRPGEADVEYSKRLETYLNQSLDALKRNFYKGLMVHYDDQKVEHHNIVGDARGVRDFWDLNEEQVASGMGVMPEMIGKAFRTTETFANITHMLLVRNANNIRRLVKRRMERTYWLDLILVGIRVDGVWFKFKENPPRDPLAEAQAEMNRVRIVLDKVKSGMIEPDMGAQELGYDAWHDPELLLNPVAPGVAMPPLGRSGRRPREFRWRGEFGRYEFVRPRVVLGGRRRDLASEQAVRAVLKQFGEKYFDAVAPFLGDATSESMRVLEGFLRRATPADFASAEDFALQAFNLLASVYTEAFSGSAARDAIAGMAAEVYEFYRLEDTAVFAKAPAVQFTMDTVDQRALAFVRRTDRFYLSKWIYNEPTERQLTDFLRSEYLEKGAGLFGRQSEESIRVFISLAVDRVEPLTEYEARRIIDTSVQRMRNWANIGQLAEAGIEIAQYVNPDPVAEICKYVTETVKYMPVAPAREAVERLAALSPEEFAATLRPLTQADISGRVADAVAEGIGFPPFHPNCKTRLVATERTSLEKRGRRRFDGRRNGCGGGEMDLVDCVGGIGVVEKARRN